LRIPCAAAAARRECLCDEFGDVAARRELTDRFGYRPLVADAALPQHVPNLGERQPRRLHQVVGEAKAPVVVVKP